MLTKFMAGGIVVLVLAMGGMYVNHRWDVARYEKQIIELQEAKAKLEVETKAQQATIEFYKKQKKVQKRVHHEKAEIDRAVGSGNIKRVRTLYQRYRVRPKGKGKDAGNGQGSHPRHKAPRKARVAPAHG